jgi:prepilin-type N-terminal cleavage/methylation domain-containing protein
MSGEKRFRSTAAFYRRHARRGLTLIEVMLVLALMVVIAAFTWPVMNNTFASQRLKKAAEIVRTQWSKSRILAMNSGRVVLFRYEIGGGRFRSDEYIDVTAFENMSNDGTTPEANATSGGNSWTPYQDTNSQNSASPPVAGEQTLPEGILFRACEIDNDSRATTATVNPAADATGISWSEPIYFYPDGTSSSAQLQIYNDRQRAVELVLRGMTGVVKVSEVTAMEGATP